MIQMSVLIPRYAKDIEEKLKTKVWATFDKDNLEGPNDGDADKPEGWGPKLLAANQRLVLGNLSEGRFEKRFDPYNAELVADYNNNTNKSKVYSKFLKIQSTKLGPQISNLETLTSQYQLYRELAKKSLVVLENAIKKLEKSKQPGEKVENTGDPFDSYFVDTVIDISDAYDKAGTAIDPAPGAKACYALAPAIGNPNS